MVPPKSSMIWNAALPRNADAAVPVSFFAAIVMFACSPYPAIRAANLTALLFRSNHAK